MIKLMTTQSPEPGLQKQVTGILVQLLNTFKRLPKLSWTWIKWIAKHSWAWIECVGNLLLKSVPLLVAVGSLIVAVATLIGLWLQSSHWLEDSRQTRESRDWDRM